MTLRYMAFNVPVVFDYLREHNYVLTVRGYDYKTEYAKVADLNATIKRVKVCEITEEEELDSFVVLSGFKTTREWWKQIKIFCKGRKWLYRVHIIDEIVSDTPAQRRERNQQLIGEYGLSAQEIKRDEREHQREFERQNAWSNEDEIAEILSHPLDIRTEPVLRDPALVDLQSFKAAARADRIKKEEEATERKHERLREMFGEQMCAAPTQDTHNPEKIMRLSGAELALKDLCGD